MIIAFAYENVHSAAEFMLMGGRACECSFFTEGDSFEGYFYVELKPSRYLKFHFSC